MFRKYILGTRYIFKHFRLLQPKSCLGVRQRQPLCKENPTDLTLGYIIRNGGCYGCGSVMKLQCSEDRILKPHHR